MQLLIWLIVISTVLVGISFLMRVLNPKVGLGLFVLLPVALVVLWQFYPPEGFSGFFYVKLFSVCLGVIYIQATKCTNITEKAWGRNLGYIILFLNILEATVMDGFDGDYANAILGLGLLLTLKGGSAVSVNEGSGHKDFEYDLSWAWVWAYCFWNFVFVYNFKGGEATPVIFFHLGLPLLLTLKKPQLFIQFRTYLLGLTIVWFTAVPKEAPFIYLANDIYVPWIGHLLTSLGFVFLGIDLYRRYGFRGQQKPGVLKKA